MMNSKVLKFHDEVVANLFPRFSHTDPRFLALAIAGEVGELANKIKKGWRDDITDIPGIQEEIVDIYVYLLLIARQYGLNGLDEIEARAITKLEEVVSRRI